MIQKKDIFEKIAVLAGGIGDERPVSLHSGQNVYQAVLKTGLEAVLSDITPDDMSILDDESIDIFFLVLHGRFGEDGQLQKILEDRNLCYTGSDSRSSADSFNKRIAKRCLEHAGLNTAPALYLQKPEDLQAAAGQIESLGSKLVVKPICQGSSVGITITESPDLARQAAADCITQFGDCMIETFVSGREITVGIVDNTPLPIIEIRPKQKFYDYHAKYEDDATEFLFGTITCNTLIRTIQQTALNAHQILGCRHLSRVDMILDEQNRPWVLEVNTLPGFTSHSLLPMAAANAGLGPDQLCMKILRAAWRDFHLQQKPILEV